MFVERLVRLRGVNPRRSPLTPALPLTAFRPTPRSTPSRTGPVKKLIDVHRMITRQFFRARAAHFVARELGRKILVPSFDRVLRSEVC